MPSRALPTNAPNLEVDTVIIGGGIQGLWLLADLLTEGYQAILLERVRPGFGQTGHSHVFLHEGHMFATGRQEPDIVQPVASVYAANSLWKTALQTGRLANLSQLKSSFYVGWIEPKKAEDFHEVCRRAKIPCKKEDIPPSEFGQLPKFDRFYKSEGICLEAKVLLDHLLSQGKVGERVGYCEDIPQATYDSGKFHLLAKCGPDKQLSNKYLKIRANALVLSAGAGNEKLVSHLLADAPIQLDTKAARQQTIKTFMLVIRDLHGSLKPASAMFPDYGGIFIVSRQDEQGRTVLLIGNGNRKLVPCPGEIIAFDAARWFQGLRKDLEPLLPDILDQPDNYEWGIYEATKAERFTTKPNGDGGAMPKTPYLYKPDAAPMWLTWPTLLTFVPQVADQLVGELKQALPHPQSSPDWEVWNNSCVRLTPVEDRWKTTPLMRWKDFEKCYASSG